jgi:transposase-like protein
MDPQSVFCPNSECLARGQVGEGNITIHSQKERRYKCNVCNTTFVETKGTIFYRRKKPHQDLEMVVTLLAYGCPVQAIVQAYGWDERTVRDVQEQAGEHCREVHEHLVEQPRDLGQVQGDEIRVKAQGIVCWLAMAIQVSTRLWLGGVVSEHRDRHLIRGLMEHVRASALCRPLLFCVDGLSAYVKAIQHAFREPIRTGKPGRPRLRPWDGIHIAQMIKRYAGRRIVKVERRIVQGAQNTIETLLQHTQGGGVINTSYIERLNGTFRSRLAALVRRGRALPRQLPALKAGVYLIGTVYNFCTYHRSLRVELALPGNRRRWLPRTPAIAAGITDHKWSVEELLWFKVPKPPQLVRGPGRPSNEFLALQARWCT